MDEIEFLVQGSSPDPYKVTFTLDVKKLNAFCTCPAGENGQYCKHRLAILGGDSSAIVSDNMDKVSLVSSWLSGTDLEEALALLLDAEREHDIAKKHLAVAKKNVAKAMRS